jgi:ATP-dependent Clp protease adaptor protein ClpS
MQNATEWQHDEDILVEDDVEIDIASDLPAHLVVYNDDVNTFDWVIDCFMEILGYTSVQAEQLALIIHTKGKATVKSDSKEVLMPLKDALNDRGLSAVIEE